MVNVVAFMLQEATPVPAGVAAFGTGMMITSLAFAVLMIASMWKVFEKAGEPGWAAIVPIYNVIILLKIVGKPVWWVILYIIPFVNLIAHILVSIALANRFGKSGGFAAGLIFLPFIFYPLLAWGDTQMSHATA